MEQHPELNEGRLRFTVIVPGGDFDTHMDIEADLEQSTFVAKIVDHPKQAPPQSPNKSE